mmetsp:Transcript_27717/g.65110  ORF Transcript_27717/g.65110 Transcript_27717/m.65110 type:complete len:563 (-) Transcript_27717:2245-3933(-)
MSSPTLKEVEGKDSENASNSSSSNGEGGGINSDNSALVSFGNTSFGFNFESDSGTNSPDEMDSDQGDRKLKAVDGKPCRDETKAAPLQPQQQQQPHSPSHPQAPNPVVVKLEGPPSTVGSTNTATACDASPAPAPLSAGAAAAKIQSCVLKPHSPNNDSAALTAAGTHRDAAATAVANLNQIATDSIERMDAANEDNEKRGLKRKTDDENAGQNSENEMEMSATEAAMYHLANVPEAATSGGSAASKGGKATGGRKKKLDDSKREERNAREKERSFRISKQINELRALLSSGGVIVPKGTKSSVLTEAANYIRMLQQHQYRSEIDRHQLVQQVQRIGSGTLGQEAAQAVRHVAAKNGVWSLGNFGGVPPRSAMMYHQPTGGPPAEDNDQAVGNGGSLSNVIEESDYRHVFNSCTIGMAIASMGGAFIDCNKFFCQISNYTKQEICSLTVFNLTARQDLQAAFDLISQMLSAPLDPTVTNTSCVLRGALKHRIDVGLSVKLIKGNDGVAKCFCVTMIRNPVSPYDTSRPIPATVAVAGQGTSVPGAKDSSQQRMNPAPAYTTG